VPHERQIIAYKRYFLDFYEELPESVQAKIEWTLNLIQEIDKIPKKYFSHMTGYKNLYEVRVEVGSNIYRIFSFFDKGSLVVLGNGFQKKSQQTPKQEIEKAIKIMKEYFDEQE
jgi:phage-related protein